VWYVSSIAGVRDMKSFRDYNQNTETIVEDDEFYSKGQFNTTGTLKEFSELPQGYFIYIIIRSGKVIFISAGMDPWRTATILKQKYQADRILYKSSTMNKAINEVAILIEKYQPPYNFKAQSIQLAELDAILAPMES
jgi:hypothetical protein